jgi:hypothetical protein
MVSVTDEYMKDYAALGEGYRHEDTDMRIPKYWEKILPQCHTLHKHHVGWSGKEPGSRGDRL